MNFDTSFKNRKTGLGSFHWDTFKLDMIFSLHLRPIQNG